VGAAAAVDAWVKENALELEVTDTADELFELLWPLLVSLSSEKHLVDTEPASAMHDLAVGWLSGNSFADLLIQLQKSGAKYPYGKQRRAFNVEMVVDLCEQTFGFEFSLVLAAVTASLEASFSAGAEERHRELLERVDELQRRLRYGLPSKDASSYFEAGFAERVVAQKLTREVIDWAETRRDAEKFLRQYADDVRPLIGTLPSYFRAAFDRIVA
jgi:hypothetical protein